MFRAAVWFVAIVGTASHEIESAETNSLLQATTAVLVDSDAELVVDTSSSLSINDDMSGQTLANAGAGTRTAHLLKLKKLNKTLNEVQCRALAASKGFEGFSTVSGTVSENLKAFATKAPSLLQMVPVAPTFLEWCATSADTWSTSSAELSEEATTLAQIGTTDDLGEQVRLLSKLISLLGDQAAAEEQLTLDAWEHCRDLQVTTLTGMCNPLHELYLQMGGHTEQAQLDAQLLQQLNGKVEAHSQLALIQGKHVTSLGEGDNLSTEAIGTLMNLLNHQQSVLSQINAFCEQMVKPIMIIMSVAGTIPEFSFDENTNEKAIQKIALCAAAMCSE